ncbi:POU domain, class 6, transcription factor 1 [Coturnix japonica]|uniref:POU domain, class 6, transcription factor 1 n=1 Tax=Coturnix japonica TaxID=93934 RepID=UPI0007776CAE|nr:POU domain, class 6, transcription factor 1 [Coturnix japonica]
MEMGWDKDGSQPHGLSSAFSLPTANGATPSATKGLGHPQPNSSLRPSEQTHEEGLSRTPNLRHVPGDHTMDAAAVRSQDAPLTVNEQVIVMSGHETIRVLEVGVDSAPPPEEEPRAAAVAPGGGPQGPPAQSGDGGSADGQPGTEPQRGAEPAAGKAKPPTGAPPGTAGSLSPPGSQQPQPLTPLTVQAAPQPQSSYPAQPPPILPQPNAAPAAKPLETQPQIAVQPAGFAFNPGIIGAASLGGQTQLLGSLAAAPVIANAIPSVQSIAGQILTNAQGQVIGTLPWVVNPPGIAAASPAPAPSLQVQAVTPQLLLNAQGQVIATLASGTIQATSSKKSGPPETPTKSEVQPIQPAPPLPQPAVVIASPAPTTKATPAPVPITCSETPTVSQLVSKPAAPNSSAEEDGINLEEIREFAKNFKIRRLSLGLTQTQVGQALTATEGPAYSQSAICRFEKLDITPKSAQKLKPVLEKWLSEAELRNQEGQQNLMEFVGGEPSKKRKRRTSFTPQAIEALNSYFEKNALPTGQEITEIAKELNYDREVVRVWFCNRRQTLKNTSKLNVFQIP